MPPEGPPDSAKVRCAVCDRPVADARLTDAQTGRVFHPSCAVGRLPEDAVIRMLGVLALIAVPAVLVWAA